jgi:hypothetical protein
MRTKHLISILTASMLSMAMAGSCLADIWLEDPTTGCEILSLGDAADKQVPVWSGSCAGGKASGLGALVVHDKDGLLLVYRGEMSGGKAEGAGSLIFRNKDGAGFDRYLGRFENNVPMGEGILESSEGTRFQADFDGSFDSGSGILSVFPEDDDGTSAVIRGDFRDGKLVGPALAFYETAAGEAYFGEMENGAREGFGTLVHANDDSYVGEFVKGKADGFGNYEGADGSMMIGIYENGAPNGPGTFIAPNGDTYQGTFIDGKAEGSILVTKVDGSQSVETWKSGEKQK